MKKIIEILHNGNYSCVIANNADIRTFTQRGIADLFDLLKSDKPFLKGASIADKVIGKGAAALLILGEINEIYADIISQSALDLLTDTNIEISYGQIVPFIENRDKTGWCPIEKLCYEEETAESILPLIEEFINRMRNKNLSK